MPFQVVEITLSGEVKSSQHIDSQPEEAGWGKKVAENLAESEDSTLYIAAINWRYIRVHGTWHYIPAY